MVRPDPLALRDAAMTEIVLVRTLPPAPRVLSFGGGVNSVALLLRLVREGNPPDLVVFADTGWEHDYTYRYLAAWVIPFCKAHGIPFAWEQSDRGDMIRWFLKRKKVMSREFRDCTWHWKIYVVRRYLRKLGVRKARMLIGIAWDENDRINTSNVKWVTHEYPLCDWRMTRRACQVEIRAAKWPDPGKSGCKGCFYAPRRQLVKFAREDPEGFALWRAMEESNPRFPEISIVEGVTFAEIQREAETQRSLEDFPDDDGGGECMTGATCPPNRTVAA